MTKNFLLKLILSSILIVFRSDLVKSGSVNNDTGVKALIDEFGHIFEDPGAGPMANPYPYIADNMNDALGVSSNSGSKAETESPSSSPPPTPVILTPSHN